MPSWLKLVFFFILGLEGASLEDMKVRRDEAKQKVEAMKEQREAAKQKAEAAREHAKRLAEEKQKSHAQRQKKMPTEEPPARMSKMSKEAAADAKLFEEQKEKAMQSWRDVYTEIAHKIEEETKKQEVMTSAQTAAVLRNLFRPPMLKGPGFNRAGVIPSDLKQQLSGYLTKHRDRSFNEPFNALLGNQRKTKMLPLPPPWIQKAGFIDNTLRPILEKLSGQTMELVQIHPGIRIYEQGSTLMNHLDSPDAPVTVSLLLSATGEGLTWPFEIGETPKPVPLVQGQMLVYEGARLPHGRRGQLKGGEVAMVFAYYRPKGYDPERVQRRLDQIMAAQKLPPRGGRPPAPGAKPKSKRSRDEFGSADEL